MINLTRVLDKALPEGEWWAPNKSNELVLPFGISETDDDIRVAVIPKGKLLLYEGDNSNHEHYVPILSTMQMLRRLYAPEDLSLAVVSAIPYVSNLYFGGDERLGCFNTNYEHNFDTEMYTEHICKIFEQRSNGFAVVCAIGIPSKVIHDIVEQLDGTPAVILAAPSDTAWLSRLRDRAYAAVVPVNANVAKCYGLLKQSNIDRELCFCLYTDNCTASPLSVKAHYLRLLVTAERQVLRTMLYKYNYEQALLQP